MHIAFWHLSNVFIGCMEFCILLLWADLYLTKKNINKKYYYSIIFINIILIYGLIYFLDTSLLRTILMTIMMFICIRIIYEGKALTHIYITAMWMGTLILADFIMTFLWRDILPPIYINVTQYNAIRTLLGMSSKILTVFIMHCQYRLIKRRELPFAPNQLLLHGAPLITLLTIYLVISDNPNLCTTGEKSVFIITSYIIFINIFWIVDFKKINFSTFFTRSIYSS